MRTPNNKKRNGKQLIPNFNDFIPYISILDWKDLEIAQVGLDHVLQEIQRELDVRTRTRNIREMIPEDDIWFEIFKLISYRRDLSAVVCLSLVCKSWFRIFSFIDEVTIYSLDSLESLKLLPNLRILSIQTLCMIPNDYFQKYIPKLSKLVKLSICETNVLASTVRLDKFPDITSFKLLPLLQKLKLECVTIYQLPLLKTFTQLRKLSFKMIENIGLPKIKAAYQSFLLNQLNQFESLKLPYFEQGIDYYQVQMNYPHIRFRWIIGYPHSFIGFFACVYEGEFGKNNTMHGRGKIIEEFSMYEGELKNGVKEGRGIEYYSDTGRYEGEWRRGFASGRGDRFYSNGDVYRGEWRNGLREGNGILYEASGGRYEGEWKCDQIEGMGIEYFADGNRYEGEFWDGYAHGRGDYFYNNGDIYRGEWRNGLREGNGILYEASGGRYDGEWKYGLKEGRGIEYFADGNRYEGEFWDGDAHGRGDYFSRNGDIFRGEWRYGMRDGNGILYEASEEIYEEKWKNDQRVGRVYRSPNNYKYRNKYWKRKR